MATTKTQPTKDIATGDNAPNMGTIGADPNTGLVADPSTGKLTTKDPGQTGQTVQTDINDILAPYIKELTNLGPEYQQEMDYLKPYLAGTPITFQGLEAGSAADESPTGSKSVQAALAGQANAVENQPAPGFGAEAQAAQEYAGTVPYSQVLQDVLQAGKNEILGYSTIPNLTNINTKGWPAGLQGVIPYLEKSIGYTGSGVPNPTTAAIQAGQQPGGYNPATNPSAPNVAPNPNNPQAGPNLSGGGNG